MKKVFYIIFLMGLPIIANSQTSNSFDFESSLSINHASLLLPQEDAYPISRFALSVNPLGFLQFGPSISAEAGLTDHLVLNIHIRFPSLGLLSYVVSDHDDGLDDLSGMAFGGGILYFFGDNRSKPYGGMLIDYNKLDCLYAKDESWEWSRTTNTIVFIFNGGYRFRFDGGFFINTGAFLGVASNKWEWEYTDTSPGSWGITDTDSREGSDIKPFGMAEVTLGIEF